MEETVIGRVLLKRYKITRLIGRGGMADVYQVRDEQANQDLAMKLLHPKLAAKPAFVEHFRWEAQTLARLEHKNIVPFSGSGEDDGCVFLLMDLVDGGSLASEALDAQGVGLTPQRVVEILAPIGDALDFAHSKGIIHCDLKPSNILRDRKGNWLLTDFGISRLTGEAESDLAGVGTGPYMAPEQIQGGRLSERTDIYSLGVLAYEMLSGGRLPFTGEHANAGESPSERILWEQKNRTPVSLQTYKPVISPALNQAVMRCLMYEPLERYASATEFLSVFCTAAEQLPSVQWSQAVEPQKKVEASKQPVSEAPITDPFGKPISLKEEKVAASRPRRGWRGFAWMIIIVFFIAAAFTGGIVLREPGFPLAAGPQITPTATAVNIPIEGTLPVLEPTDLVISSDAHVAVRAIQGEVYFKIPGGSSITLISSSMVPYQEGIRIWTTSGKTTLELPTGAVIYINENTTLSLIRQPAKEGQSQGVSLQLERGSMLVQTGIGRITVESNQQDYWGSAAKDSVIGFIYDPMQDYFWVDCLSGISMVGAGMNIDVIPPGLRAGYDQRTFQPAGAPPHEFWRQLIGDAIVPGLSETPVPTATSDKKPATAQPTAAVTGSINVRQSDGALFYSREQSAEDAATPGQTISIREGVRIWTGYGKAILEMSSGVLIYLSDRTAVSFVLSAHNQDGTPELTLRLEDGSLLVQSQVSKIAIESVNQSGYGRLDRDALAGFTYDPMHDRYTMDCLAGMCVVGSSLLTRQVQPGMRAICSANQISVVPGEANKVFWRSLAGETVVP